MSARGSEVPRLSYSLREAAEALSLGVSTLQRAIRHGLVRSAKMGRVVRMPVTEVERISREGLGQLPARKRSTGKVPGTGRRKKTPVAH